MNGPESNYTAWIAKAENDLLNVENNLLASRVPWDTVCFHAQQVAEKMLKALLVFRGLAPIRTHDLVALLAKCVEIESELENLEEDCRRLTVYAVGSRYPDDLFDPTEQDALEMVAAAKRVREKVLERLP
jgi:HEPN domain-containing protein